MLTIRAAADALAHASSLDGLAEVTAELGFSAPLPLDAKTRESLGISPRIPEVRIARGRGMLRALLVELPGETVVRTEIALLASKLASRSPHLLWLLGAFIRGGDECAIATWSIPRDSVRIAALVVDRRRILDSDAETVCALSAAPGENDLLTHARWQEILGRESLTRRFYRTLHDVVIELGEHATGGGRPAERHEAALLYVSRLLFLSFLEAKGWLNGDRAFLTRGFEDCCSRSGGYEQRVLRPLFFGTLNTPITARATRARAFGRIPFLNGGLFAPTTLERQLRHLRFGDEYLGRVYSELIGRYRFTAREDSTSWSEAAVDPEMLGKAFESLMASNDRKSSGAFYTPHALVERVTRAALTTAFGDDRQLPDSVIPRLLAGEAMQPAHLATLRNRLATISVLDPACGSGAFLVHVMSEIALLRSAAGDPLPPAQLRRDVLQQSIFGVDLNPMAVWLCELRLWLAVVIESDERDPLRVPPLPNLDHHIWVGDTLLGGDFSASVAGRGAGQLTALRSRYARSSGARKRVLSRTLERAERGFALAAIDRTSATIATQRRDIIVAQRGLDLFGERRTPDRAGRARMVELRSRARELRNQRRTLEQGGALPFSFPAHFPDIAARGGFDVVVGNPPWVRLHRIPRRTREILRRDFSVFRNAAWSEGAIGARAGVGFASQVDLSALFVERSVDLLRERGAISMLLPAKLWRSLAGGGVRHLLRSRSRLLEIEDWSDSAATFEAAVYPSLLVARRGSALPTVNDDVHLTVHNGSTARRWSSPIAQLGVRKDLAAPWLLLPSDARRAFDAIADVGIPMVDSVLGRPMLGVKCGCNDAFVLSVIASDGELARIRSNGSRGTVEAALLRPVLRGGGVTPWRVAETAERLLWTHDENRRPFARLPPHAAKWLAGWRHELTSRADARASSRWWSLYRTEAAMNDLPRVVWSDFGKVPRAALLPRGDPTVPLNSCYVSRCESDDDALALLVLLNSPLAAAWLNALAEPARGGFHRYLAWTVSMLPVPADWERTRALLAPLARAAICGNPPALDLLTSEVAGAYGLSASTVAPLVQWMTR